MANIHLYDVHFEVKVYCGGVYKYIPASLRLTGTDSADAMKKLKNCTFEIASISAAKEILLN